jgi:hypothetical protein
MEVVMVVVEVEGGGYGDLEVDCGGFMVVGERLKMKLWWLEFVRDEEYG